MALLTWKQLHDEMESCEQTPGMSVRQHGRSVYKYSGYLNEMLSLGISIKEKFRIKIDWKLPTWFHDYEEELAWERCDSDVVYWYIHYHDCGKPFCKTMDEEGKSHFPNHAQVSYETWMKVNQDDPIGISQRSIERIGQLILHDMDIHTMNAEQIDQLMTELDSYSMTTLLITALSEIHSNAEMFGGIDSQGFKMKFKQIERRGRQICKKLFEKGE